MGRPEKPLDHTRHPARARLAGFLRDARNKAGPNETILNYDELATRAKSSAATLKRAADGTGVPTRGVVEDYVTACARDDVAARILVANAVRLWKRARWEQKRPGRDYLAPQTKFIRDWRDLSGVLRDLHAYAGSPSVQEMERRAGGLGILPHSTAHRILTMRSVPTSEAQLRGFLIACEVPTANHPAWMEAFEKCTSGTLASGLPRTQPQLRITSAPGSSAMVLAQVEVRAG
ncbi:helix-turn-helix domain-containing protein [Streptomyces europaeiscabiei]|uniref:helix-turn-helix domain-containing protein n=1 Tax=Streptomyces europaeiscabiei TaxID=146819 RepID=UPI000E684504|nr:helix-turn-helix domain-containing protein [Streptomyces europaeiscabiei]